MPADLKAMSARWDRMVDDLRYPTGTADYRDEIAGEIRVALRRLSELERENAEIKRTVVDWAEAGRINWRENAYEIRASRSLIDNLKAQLETAP